MCLQDGGAVGLDLGVCEGSVGVVGSDIGVELNGLCVLFDCLLILLVY